MTIAHIYFSAQTEYGKNLRSALTSVEDGTARLVQVRDTMTFMIDGDGSSSTQFTEVVARFGFSVTGGDAAANAVAAKAAWDEMNSYIGKITTDASVSSVDAARKQLMNKLR